MLKYSVEEPRQLQVLRRIGVCSVIAGTKGPSIRRSASGQFVYPSVLRKSSHSTLHTWSGISTYSTSAPSLTTLLLKYLAKLLPMGQGRGERQLGSRQCGQRAKDSVEAHSQKENYMTQESGPSLPPSSWGIRHVTKTEFSNLPKYNEVPAILTILGRT